VYIVNLHGCSFDTRIRIADPVVRNVWNVVSAVSALALVILLLSRHVLESHMGNRSRRNLDLTLLPLFLAFVASIVVRPFL